MDFKNCQLRSTCKTPDRCSLKCFPYTLMHGVEGKTGLWKARNVPKKYENVGAHNLPQITPASTRATMLRYMDNCMKHVTNGTGMFLYSVADKSNPLGTGTGKTTSACAIVNTYLQKRTLLHLTGGAKITNNPALFLKMADFQNTYNSQFRGTFEQQALASENYYFFKERMKKVELLVIDDIAVRNATEAFLNECYEIIDHRVTEEKATIYTSNVDLKELPRILGERIVSRIIGSTFAYPFNGADHRLEGKVI